MKIKKQLSVYVLCLFACTFFFTGCKKDVYDPNKEESLGNDFDYATRSVKSLDINYGIEGYKAVFEIYTENPITTTEDGASIKKEGITAPLKAYTNDNCQYKGSINLPTATEKVYLYSENLGLPRCIELEVNNNTIKFDRDKYVNNSSPVAAQSMILRSRTVISKQAEATSHFAKDYNILESLGGWSGPTGIPDYIIKDNRGIAVSGNTPDGLLTRLNSSISKNDAGNSEVKVLKNNTTIELVFLNGNGKYTNTLGYYYYEGEKPEDINTLPLYIAFPNCITYGANNGGLYDGNRIHLQYFGKDGQQTASDEFPEGVTIGWFIIVDGFANTINPDAHHQGEINYNKPIRFANPEFNASRESFSARYYDEQTETSAIAFEDNNRGGTYDYKDVVFYLDVTKGSIDIGGKPTGPGTHEPQTGGEVSGTLAFEDLWPNKGDYDMNDVVVTYEHSYTFDGDNNIIALKSIYTPVHHGGQIQSAFGYQIDIDANAGFISEIKMDNKNTSEAVVSNHMEVNQEKMTFILFDDVVQAVNNGAITIEVILDKGGLTVEDVQNNTKFYNPFICVNRNKGENPVTAKSRREIHLTNYEPTSLAGILFDFGRYDDRSDIDKDNKAIGPRYYVGEQNNPYPFAIDLPIKDYQWSDEMVKIDDFYPNFTKWVTSKGEDNKDWYLHRAE